MTFTRVVAVFISVPFVILVLPEMDRDVTQCSLYMDGLHRPDLHLRFLHSVGWALMGMYR